MNQVIKYFLISSTILFNSCLTFKKNQIKNGQQHGYWITYIDKSKIQIQNEGRFRNGVQIGKWKYNDLSGKKERIEIYRGNKMRIKYFHPNGNMAVKGRARIINEDKKLHFFYFGNWFFYTDKGKLEKISVYENGNLVSEKYLNQSGNLNDSLVLQLTRIDAYFQKNNDSLNQLYSALGPKSEGYKKAFLMHQMKDSLVHQELELIVNKFGYPSKAMVGDKNTILFYIIGFAPFQVKEKFLSHFKLATEKGEISLKDYAFFEDKYNVAKFGWQNYGTQTKKVSNFETRYYPVKKLAELNDRRKKMGLEVQNLLVYEEMKE